MPQQAAAHNSISNITRPSKTIPYIENMGLQVCNPMFDLKVNSLDPGCSKFFTENIFKSTSKHGIDNKSSHKCRQGLLILRFQMFNFKRHHPLATYLIIICLIVIIPWSSVSAQAIGKPGGSENRGLFKPAATVAFSKTLPANGATISMPASTEQILQWGNAEIDLTDAYQYCIDETNDSLCAGDQWITRSLLYSGGPAEFTLLPGHTYYWQVKVRDANIFADSNTWWSFSILPPQLNKIAPLNGSTLTLPITTYRLLQWSDAEINVTDRYQYCIDETNNAKCDDGNWISRDSLYSGGPGDFATLGGHTYYWQVRARDANKYADSGSWWSFTIEATGPQPPPLTKIYPANGAFIPLPGSTYHLLQWSDAVLESTDRYQYCIDETDNSLCEDNNWITRNSLYSGLDEFPTLPEHTYYWQVRARDAGANANTGTWWSFTTLPAFIEITRLGENPTSATSVVFEVTFNGYVTDVETSDFSLTTSNITGAGITTVTAVSSSIYNVTVNTGSGSGTIRLDIPVTATILDATNSQIPGLPFTRGPTYTINKTLSTTFTSTAANDGWIMESNENSGAGGTLDSAANTFNLGDNAANKQYRSILHFNTAALPDNAVVTKATLKIKKQGLTGNDPFSILGLLRVDMRKPSFGSATLELTDFNSSTNKRNVSYFNPIPSGAWYSALLNNTGNLAINLQGRTQFRLYFTLDDNNDNGADLMRFFSGNAPAGSWPQLIVEYYLQ